MVPQHLHLRPQLRVVGRYRAGFPERPQILARIKAKTSDRAKAAGPLALVLSSVRLAGIFPDRRSMSPPQCKNSVHVCHLAEDVDGNYGLRAQSNGRLEF